MSDQADSLRTVLSDAMDIVALTDERARTLVAPVMRRILALREHHVPEPVVNALIDDLRACCAFNSEISAKAQDVCGILDVLARRRRDVEETLTLKGLARTLGPALMVLNDPQAHPAGDYVAAVRTLDEVAALVPRERLLSKQLAHELGSRRARTLTRHFLPRPEGVGGRVAANGSAPHLTQVAAA